MKHILTATALSLAAFGLTTTALTTGAAAQQSGTADGEAEGTPIEVENGVIEGAELEEGSFEDTSAFVDFQVLKPEIALEIAISAVDACREEGYQVGATVVDRFGLPQAFLRDRFAGPHVYETSRRKAWTAISFKSDTLDLAEETEAGLPSSGIRHLSEALPLGGGKVVVAGDGSIVAGIGVSGAPSPEIDDECAAAGIAAVEDQIAF